MDQQSHTIHYDMQTNTFYNIDKGTGLMARSYKNGQKLPTFKPTITGFEYRQRNKAIDTIHKRHYSYKTNGSLRSSASKQKIKIPSDNLHTNYKTLSLYEPKQKSHQRKKTLLSITSSPKNKTSFDEIRSIDFSNGYSSKISENPRQAVSAFDTLAKRFSQLTESKVRINHSPNKSLEGSVEKKDRLQTLCMTRTNFRNQDQPENGYKNVHKKEIPSIPRKLILENKFAEKEQIKKDRIMAQLLNPSLIIRQNEKSLQKQKDRKRNLLILQKLTIDKNNRLTKRIFVEKN